MSRGRRWYWRAGPAPFGAPAAGVTHSRAWLNRLDTTPAGTYPTQRLLPALNAANPISWQTISVSAPGSIATTGAARLAAVFVSDPLAAQTIPAGPWVVKTLGGRGSAYGGISLTIALYLWDPVGGAVRAYLHDSAELFQYSGFSINQGVITLAVPGLQATAVAGDLLVCETWMVFYEGGSATGSVWFNYDGGSDTFASWLDSVSASYVEAPFPVLLQAQALPIFAAAPNWDQGVTERIRFATDMVVATDGSELRQQLRRVPDRILGFRPLASTADELTRLDALLLSGHRGYRVPWWPDAERLGAAVSAAAATIATPGQDATQRRYSAGGQAVLIRDDGTAEAVDLTAVANTALTLAAGQPLATWGAGTWIAPLCRAWLTDSPSVHRAARFTGESDLAFRLEAIPTPVGEP